MRARKPAAATAVVAGPVLIVLFTAGLGAAPIALSESIAIDQSVRPPNTIVVPASVASNNATGTHSAETSFDASQLIGPTRRPQPGDYPLRRRRNRMPFWQHVTSWTRSSSPLTWIVALPLALLGIGAAPAVFFLRRWFRQKGRDATGFAGIHDVSGFASTTSPNYDTTTNDRLRTLTELHASGALTDAEFEAERRRIIGGGGFN